MEKYQDVRADTRICSRRGNGLCGEYIRLQIGNVVLLVDIDQIKRVKKALSVKTQKIKDS